MNVYVYTVHLLRKINRLEWQWKMRGTSSFSSDAKMPTKGTDGLKGNETVRVMHTNWINKSLWAKKKPKKLCETYIRQLIGQSKDIKRNVQTDTEEEATVPRSASELKWEVAGVLSSSLVDKERLMLPKHASPRLACTLLSQSLSSI